MPSPDSSAPGGANPATEQAHPQTAVAEDQLFDFAVPAALLKEAVERHRDETHIANLDVVPGTGEGESPPIRRILQQRGYAPLLLTVAAFIPTMHANAISLLGPTIQKAFHIANEPLLTIAFVGQAAQLLWALPLALWADRGSRRLVAGLALIIFAVFGSFMGLSPNDWTLAFLYIGASVGLAMPNTVHNTYLSDQYTVEGRGRVFTLHRLWAPLATTLGYGMIALAVAIGHSWRFGLIWAVFALPLGFFVLRIPEPKKGSNETSHILSSSGMDLASQQENAPRVLLGSAITRLLRIKSIYFELIAISILGFAGTGVPLLSSLFFHDKFHLTVNGRTAVFIAINAVQFLGLIVAYRWGDQFFRKAPQRPLVLSGFCISAYGVIYLCSLYVPKLWMCIALQTMANAATIPLAIWIFLTLAATTPPEMRTICLAMFGVVALVFGGFFGTVVLGAVSDEIGGLHGVVVALSIIAPVCVAGGIFLWIGSRYVLRDISLVIEDVLERYAEGQRRQSGGHIAALQVHNLDFFYGTNQVLFNMNLDVEDGEMVALLGTNGAGKSTLLRAVSGLEHPHRGVVRIFGVNTTYLEPEQIIGQGVVLLVGGKMTFPGLTVADNLRVGEYTLRGDKAKARAAMDEALDLFPELRSRLDQRAGTLSGGEQQMLALSRSLMTRPKLLMIDELALGLAPKTVDSLMTIVRRVNAAGTSVILVEQSVNRAIHLAERAFFIERGEVKFDGPTRTLLERDDLLRPVFLAEAGSGLQLDPA